MADQASLRDRVLAGRYRLESRLGAGGMGSIWRAHHLVLAAPVAVKLIDREALPDEETIARFMREAQAAAALRSPHVVQILDYGIDQTLPFIVMELLEGENLAQRLRRQRRLSPPETARVVTQTSRAVQRAHDAGIIHRDLKPENVFLIKNEDEEVAKVLDFGVAKVDVTKVDRGQLGSDSTRTRTGSILGTPYYMSPEQAQGNKTVDHRSDLWALGVIAFECITGKRPFYSDGLGDLVLQICIRDIPVPSEHASVPIGFDAWFAKAVARDPEKRFQSARELSDALRDVLGVSRELAWAPEVSVSSGDFPDEPRAPSSQAKTVVADTNSHVRLTSNSTPADENALTVAVVPASDSVRGQKSSPDIEPGPTRVDALADEPPPSRSGLGLVFVVAATALAIGLAAGLSVLMMKQRNAALRPLPPAVPPAHAAASAAPVVRPERSASHSGELTSAAASADKSVPGAAGAAHAAGAAPDSKAAAAHSAGTQPVTPAADGGWVKPAWAIPDDEPKRVDAGP